MANEPIVVGTRGLVNVGQNTIEVEYVGKAEKGFIVRSLKTGKEFTSMSFIEPPPPKRSLFAAAVEVLRLAKMPMNTREIIDAAIELKLWQPTGAKTPEQTLYGAIVRENNTKEQPRIVKSDIKGKFIYAGE